MPNIIKVVIAIFITAVSSLNAHEKVYIVTTESGKVLGKSALDRKGNTFFSFESIPYAKPPTGWLRFKTPEPVEPWKKTLFALTKPPLCPQIKGDILEGQEDCLYLNIYTPKLPKCGARQKLKPVMVYIHGGRFIRGSSNEANPDYLISHGIVLVTINYRLGVLGFLNFGNQNFDFASNAGMKDQVMALKWINKNIKYFGGDPHSVTLFGNDAGGASAHFHTLSLMSKGLFHKIISQSGTALNLWANSDENNGLLLCQKLKVCFLNNRAMMTFFRRVPLVKLMQAQMEMSMIVGVDQQPIFGVVAENHKNSQAFLSDLPVNIITSAKFNDVPTIIGYNSQEGMLLQIQSKLKTGKFRTIENFARFVPYNLIRKRTNYNEMNYEISNFYNKTAEKKCNLQTSINFITDIWFYYHIYKTAIEQSKKSKKPLYFYRFSADTILNKSKRNVLQLYKYRGASHFDELGYLFNYTHYISPNSVEEKNIERMTKLWTNFAKFENPTPKTDVLFNKQKWKPFTPSENFVLEIDNDLHASVNPDFTRYQFWNYMYDVYFE